jgi:outer membrane protein assembly factor BamD (BamD/ComL family)
VSDPQREFDAWEAAGRVGTRASFEAFIAQYPDGRYTPQARIRLAGLQAAPAAPVAVAQAKPSSANNPQLEFETWDRAATSKRRDDYEQYLAAYPSGRYAELARAALKKLP